MLKQRYDHAHLEKLPIPEGLVTRIHIGAVFEMRKFTKLLSKHRQTPNTLCVIKSQ